MSNEQLRMQMLAGIITEGEYKQKLKEYNSSFNAYKKYMENPEELVEMLEESGVELDDEIYIFFNQTLDMDDLMDPDNDDFYKDITIGRKENPNSPWRTNRDDWMNKELFQVIQKSDFIDSPEKIREVMDFYYYQPFNMEDFFTTGYFDDLEEAKEEWENLHSKNRLLTYEEYKQLFDTYGPDNKMIEWN